MKYLLPFILFINLSCSSSQTNKSQDKTDSPILDTYVQDSKGRISFARTHFPLAKVEAMNRIRRNKTQGFMRDICKGGRHVLMRSYQTESDLVSLKTKYPENINVQVYEFQCRL